MEVQKFDFEQAKQLFEAGPMLKLGKKEIRTVSQACKDYIGKYFFQSKVDNYYFWDADANDFTVYTKETVKNVYICKLADEINYWFFRENTKLYNVINEVNAPRIRDNNLNLFSGLLHCNAQQKFDEYSEEVKDNVKLFLSFMKEVLCSGDNDAFRYLKKWIANMCQGNKNDSCLYLKGPEGIGKSTLSDFLKKYVLGDKITTNSKSDTLRSNFNKILCGKLLVVFEELPNFSDREWEGISATLKDYITGNETLYADKFEKQFKASNINNYIINTNVDAIKHSEGRRYYIMDLSTKRKSDHVYFGNLKANCFNMEVGKAFFAHMKEVNVEGFNAQKDMPVTENKLNAIAERLDIVYQFIKDEFILKKLDINMPVTELYAKYSLYTEAQMKRPLGKIKFCSKLREIQLEYKKCHGINKYRYKYTNLKKIADKCKWIHDLDEFNADAPAMQKNEVDYFDNDDIVCDAHVIKDRKITQLLKQLQQLQEADADRVNARIDKFLIEHKKTREVFNAFLKESQQTTITVEEDVNDVMSMFDD